jgi:SagB-type dehydrogenase family enzyme
MIAIAIIVLLSALAPAASAQNEDSSLASIGARFHYETSFGDEGSKTLNPHWGEQIPLFKSYDDAERVSLPTGTIGEMPVERAIDARRSIRSFADRPLRLADLSRVLHAAYGITRTLDDTPHRGVPSAGALYPIEIYVSVSNVDSLQPGIYHFHPSDTSLEWILEGDYTGAVYEGTNSQRAVESCPAVLIITARFDRTTSKYADRGYRYVYIEAGAVCQNVYLQAGSLGLGTCAMGAFNDDALSALLELDGITEAPLLVMPLGIPTAE